MKVLVARLREQHLPPSPRRYPSSSSKKGVIFFLILAGAIFLVEKMCFSEFRIGIGIIALAALIGMALYLTH